MLKPPTIPEEKPMTYDQKFLVLWFALVSVLPVTAAVLHVLTQTDWVQF